MRLLGGIIRFSLSFYWFVIGPEYEDTWYHYLRNQNYSLDTVNMYGLIFLIPYCIAVYYFVLGAYMMFTANYSVADLAYNINSNGSNNNIQSVLNYRNGIMNTMSNEKASQEYLATSWLDGAMNTSGTNTKNAVKYLNGKLGTMSNENGLKYIKGVSKK